MPRGRWRLSNHIGNAYENSGKATKYRIVSHGARVQSPEESMQYFSYKSPLVLSQYWRVNIRCSSLSLHLCFAEWHTDVMSMRVPQCGQWPGHVQYLRAPLSHKGVFLLAHCLHLHYLFTPLSSCTLQLCLNLIYLRPP